MFLGYCMALCLAVCYLKSLNHYCLFFSFIHYCVVAKDVKLVPTAAMSDARH